MNIERLARDVYERLLLARDVYARLDRIKYLGRNRLDNLYFATVQKAGSQWMSAIFNDPRMKAVTGLARMPQRNYEYGEHIRKFPKGFFVPGLYVSYQMFQNGIAKPKRYKVVYIYRDPRDLVVSDYYSKLKTHEENPAVIRARTELASMSKEDGISYVMRWYDKFSFMRSWVELGHKDPSIMFLKFEDLTANPVEKINLILAHCGIAIDERKLQNILADYTKDNMRTRDLARRTDKSESHYRFKASSYRDEFTTEHYRLFSQITGNLLEVLGYS